MDIGGIYRKLKQVYGPQGWWPLLIAGNHPDVVYGIPYQELRNYKTSFRDPYFEIAVGAILTQNTSWKNAEKAINGLYYANVLTSGKIFKMSVIELQNIIRPAGYFRQKAKKMQLFSGWLIENYGGNILKLKDHQPQVIREKLLSNWGIGPETADSILLYALNIPVFVVDAYTKRLCEKYGIMYREYQDYKNLFEGNLKRDAKLYQEYHALIVASGKEKHNKVV